MSELGPEARALLEAVQGADDPSPEDAARVREKLALRLALAAAAGSAASLSAPPAAGAVASSTTTATTAATGSAATAAAVGGTATGGGGTAATLGAAAGIASTGAAGGAAVGAGGVALSTKVLLAAALTGSAIVGGGALSGALFEGAPSSLEAPQTSLGAPAPGTLLSTPLPSTPLPSAEMDGPHDARESTPPLATDRGASSLHAGPHGDAASPHAADPPVTAAPQSTAAPQNTAQQNTAPQSATPLAADSPGPGSVGHGSFGDGSATSAPLDTDAPDRGTPTPTGPIQDSVAEEAALLRAARAALARGDGAAALEHLQVHATRFPRGALAEERRAARVFALCAAGRTLESRAAAARFVAGSPGSPLAEQVRRTCAAPSPGDDDFSTRAAPSDHP